MYGLNQIIAAAQKGALDAQIQYSKWSGGFGVVNSGVENFVSAKIAESIYTQLSERRKLYVGLEYPVRDIIFNAERKIRGRKGGRLDENGRVDVIVWDADEKPRVIIEVKRQFFWSAIENDADRIFRFLNKFGSHYEGGSISAGIIIIPFIKWIRADRDGMHPSKETIADVKERVAAMGFKMEKISSVSLDPDDRFRYPENIADDDEYVGRENIEYCCACFTMKAKDL